MRLLHYNVLFETIHLQLLADIVRQTDPDIISLNEVHPQELEQLQKSGYHTAFVETPREGKYYGNGNAIAWKPSLQMKSFRSLVKDFKTPLLEGVTNDFSVYVMHLAAKEGEEKRLQEIQKVLSIIPPHTEYFLVGDLNSLSPQDPYDYVQFENKMREHGHAKFGIPVSCATISYLQKQGLQDLQHCYGKWEATVPTTEGTPEKEKMQHFVPLRLDYVFATPGLAAKTTEVTVVKNELTEKCSDHYPLLVEGKF